MKLSLRAASVAFSLLAASAARAGTGAEPFDFLRLDADARAVGLAGAYTALAQDANALLYNPAGLGRIRRNEATFMHSASYEGISQEYAAIAFRRGWGASVNYLNFGGVQKATISNPGGSGLGSTGLSDLALSGGYGRAWGDLAVGAGAKFIRETIDQNSRSGFALDLGVHSRVAAVKGLGIGAALLNLGPDVKYQRASEPLPLALRAGAAYEFPFDKHAGTFALDLIKVRSESIAVAFGSEVVLNNSFPIRLGFTNKHDSGPGVTAGAGYRQKDYRVDYAFVPYGSLGYAHRISASLRWGPEDAPDGVRTLR